MLNVFSSKHNKWHAFKFDRVFGEDSNQDEVYQETQPLIRSVLDGACLPACMHARVWADASRQAVASCACMPMGRRHTDTPSLCHGVFLPLAQSCIFYAHG